MIKLFPHQQRELDETEGFNRVAYYHDMGLGKTYTGAEKMHRLGARVNLVICQKSKVEDWANHFIENYHTEYFVHDLTKKRDYDSFFRVAKDFFVVGVINYELAFRRPQLKELRDFTLMLDESSMVQNENAKRSRFILSLSPANVILLSGTPTGGKYEKLWSQMKLLGWRISKTSFWNQYVDYSIDTRQGFPLKIVRGYKNVDRLKEKMREHGCRFLKTEDILDLPSQNFNTISIAPATDYRKFKKDRVVYIDGVELVGDTTLTKMLYERRLCGHYNDNKLCAFRDLLESTEDRLIVFYNFTAELDAMAHICELWERPVSVVNGQQKDLKAYENREDSVTFVQYQAGAMGLNLQKANKIIYFTPPLSSELFEQSKKRIHRIGQDKPCFYYMLTVKGSVEGRIYSALKMRKDYTEALFEMDGGES